MLIYIKPLSTFPKLHSDTLFGAITAAISELYPDMVEDMLYEFENGRPPFILSSAFPYIYNDDTKIRFYPKIIQDYDSSEIDRDVLKKYKKISFIDEEIFLGLINGDLTEIDLLNEYGKYYESGSLLMAKDYGINARIAGNILPNNSVNRLTNESEAIFYSQGDTFQNMGLFFAVILFDEKYENIIKSVFKFLKDRGFGRDLSTGKGQFDYEITDDSIDNFEIIEGNSFVTLSRYIPTEDDLDKINEYSSYEIDSKRGRHPSGEIRKEVKFFKEGSTFPNYQLTYGGIVKSSDVNPAVEYGYAFPVRFDRSDMNEWSFQLWS